MVQCRACGRENSEDAKYCRYCGALLQTSAQSEYVPYLPPPAPPAGSLGPPADLGQRMSEAGRRFGEEMGRMGKEMGEQARRSAVRAGIWWDRVFGLLSPVVLGLIGLLVLLIFVLVASAAASVSHHERFLRDLVDFIGANILIFVGLIFLNSFSNYFNRRYRRYYRWVFPVALGIGFVGWFWIFAEVLEIAHTDALGPSELGTASLLIEVVLPLLFLLVVAIGYLALLFDVVVRDELHRNPMYGRK